MRRLKAIAILSVALGLCLGAVGPALAGDDEASGVSSRRGDASPTAGTSNVDEYTFQDEQINIDGGKDSIVKVLRVNQKNLVNDYVVAVIPFQNATPKEIRSLFRLITAKEGGRAEVIRDKVGKKQYLHVICPQFQLPYIEAALKALDESWIQEDIDGSYQAYYRAKFRDVANIDELAEVPGGSDGGTTVIDETTNSVFVRGEPYRIGSYLKTAELVDVFPPQVVLDAAVYEVELSSDLKLGLDYVAWKCGPGRSLFDFVAWGFRSSQKADEVTSSFDPFVDALDVIGGTERITSRGRGYYAAANWLLSSEFLDFMVRKGKARLVTSGRLNVRHNTIGTLSLTDQVLHFDVEPDESDLLDDGETVSSFESLIADRCLTHRNGDVNVGFTLVVAPFIGLETSELVYALTQSDIIGATPSGTPIVRNNTLLGTVLMRDGVSLCLGGLKRTEEVKSTAKMPVLGSIPILGYLFGGEQNADRQTEMVVVLTPRVVQYSEVHKELARAEDALVRAQVAHRAALPMLKTEYGFDQWLLGKD
ncbi:MAG: hypothetical protein AMK73_02005 [Planctomycetes bacterium SM23_32]|nr:MAG: hypothetical protein AMK73_02005 [Planctomycetes bacterium SM23_32]